MNGFEYRFRFIFFCRIVFLIVLCSNVSVGASFNIPKLANDDWEKAFRLEKLLALDSGNDVLRDFEAKAKIGWNSEGLLISV